MIGMPAGFSAPCLPPSGLLERFVTYSDNRPGGWVRCVGSAEGKCRIAPGHRFTQSKWRDRLELCRTKLECVNAQTADRALLQGGSKGVILITQQNAHAIEE